MTTPDIREQERTVEDDSVLLEFLNQNMHRNYPIRDTLVVKTDSGIYLPSSFLVDCQIIVPCTADEQSAIDPTRFFVAAVNRYTNSVQVLIGYQPENGTAFTCAASAAIVLSDEAQPLYPTTVSLSPSAGIPSDEAYDPLRKLTGTLWIGSTVGMTNLGSLAFTYESAALRKACIVRNLVVSEVVTHLTIVDSAGVPVATLSGDIVLTTDGSITLNYTPPVVDQETEEVITPGSLEIAVNQTWLDAQITSIMQTAGSPIQTINGQSPDSSGNFTISGLDCTDIQQFEGTNGIAVKNTCSKPCCGEDSGDLADVKSTQKTLQSQVSRISENMNSLINSINNVETRLPSLVASRK